jgi:hypothetical protein
MEEVESWRAHSRHPVTVILLGTAGLPNTGEYYCRMRLMTTVSVLNALLTPLIAVIATYIAWQQSKGNQLKLKMERFDRRIRIYQEVVKMLRTCVNGGLREFSVILEFGASTAQADFLFDPEIRLYLNEISTLAAKMRAANVQYRDFTQPVHVGYNHEKIASETTAQVSWFTEQLVGFIAKNKFGKYLNIS